MKGKPKFRPRGGPKLSRIDRKLKRISEKATLMTAKAGKRRAKADLRDATAGLRRARLADNAQRGGLVGTVARKIQTAVAKNEARIRKALQEPDLIKMGKETEIKTKSEVAKTRARGAAAAGVASALGGGLYGKAKEEAKAAIAKSKADEEFAKSLTSNLQDVPQVTEDPYSNGSVSGLVTGVR